MDSIVLSTCDVCCTIQLLWHMLSPPCAPLQLPASEPSSSLDQGYKSDQASGGPSFPRREYLQVGVVQQVQPLWVDESDDYAHRWPFRCTNSSRTMMARVDPSLQVVKSHQVIALHSLIFGDNVDSEPQVGSRRIMSFCRLSTGHVFGECWPHSRHGHWTRIQINFDDASGGDIDPQRYWFESELTQVSVTHSQQHQTLPNAGGRFRLSSLQSPQWGRILRHCELYQHSSLRADDNEGRFS